MLCPEQFAQGESVQVHLTPFDRGGALAWGPTGGDPSALPLGVLTSTRQFGRWEAGLTRYEKDTARAKLPPALESPSAT